MNAMIETLEGRTMFSATILHTPHVGATHGPAVHAAKTVARVVTYTFRGTAFNTSQNRLAANLMMTITKGDKGFVGNVVATDPGNGSVTKFTVQFDANGHFFSNLGESNGNKLHVEGQLNTDKNTVSGNWTETRKDGSSVGTLSLTRSDNVTPTPTPAPATGVHYVGLATGSDGKSSGLTMDIVKTTDGSYFGILKHANSDGTFDTITVKFDASGHFNFKGGDSGNGPQLEGQLSADKSTCTGGFKINHTDRPADTGTFSLKRA